MIENNIICSKCVMDTSDPNIKFNDHGVCDHCINFDNNIHDKWKENIKDSKELSTLAKKIKKQGAGKDFDCIIGLSGGLDSSYATYIVKEKMGLRPCYFMLMLDGTLIKQ